MTNRPATDAPARIAVISDVHSEPEALDSVLDAIDAAEIERMWCLGDIVGGRGIDPVGVFDRVMDRCELVLAGNHDRIVTGDLAPWGSGPFPGLEKSTTYLANAGDGRMNRLSLLPTQLTASADGYSFTLAHGCPAPFDTASAYIEEHVAPKEIFATSSMVDVVLVGHTHVPAAWTEPGDRRHPEPGGPDRTSFTIARGTPLIINPGAVCPGRDGDGRPTWLELELGPNEITATWHRSGEAAFAFEDA